MEKSNNNFMNINVQVLTTITWSYHFVLMMNNVEDVCVIDVEIFITIRIYFFLRDLSES